MMTHLECLRVLKDVADRQPEGLENDFRTCLARAAAHDPCLAKEFGPLSAPWFILGPDAGAFARFFGIDYECAALLMSSGSIWFKRPKLCALIETKETVERLLRRRDETVAQLAALTDAPREKVDA